MMTKLQDKTKAGNVVLKCIKLQINIHVENLMYSGFMLLHSKFAAFKIKWKVELLNSEFSLQFQVMQTYNC